MKLHISNLPPDTTEEELIKLFSQFGKVKSVKIFEYPSNLSNGYGFIDAPPLKEKHSDSKNFKGKIISISEVRSRN